MSKESCDQLCAQMQIEMNRYIASGFIAGDCLPFALQDLADRVGLGPTERGELDARYREWSGLG